MPETNPATTDPKPGTEFVAAFGAQGAVWFLEGRKFADCVAEFNTNVAKQNTDAITELKTKHEAEVTALKAQVTDLQTKLASAPRGNDAASFSTEKKPESKTVTNPKFAHLSDNTAKFAAGIRFAGTKE